jgi:hypothetical protein
MTMKASLNKFESMDIIEKRIYYLLGSRLRNKNRMQTAVEAQKKIRQNHSVARNWNSVTQIRKWRKQRKNLCASNFGSLTSLLKD